MEASAGYAEIGAVETTRIAQTMTGAVSLGSFEAGVLTEPLWALAKRSEHGQKYELDVITGASAGAMTAGFVANLVMNGFSQRENLIGPAVGHLVYSRLNVLLDL